MNSSRLMVWSPSTSKTSKSVQASRSVNPNCTKRRFDVYLKDVSTNDLCAWIEMKIPDPWRFWCSSRFVQCGGIASWVGCSWSQHISTTRAHGDTICSLVMTKCYARGIHCIDLDCWKECLHRFIVKHPEQVQTNCSEIPQAHSARRQDCKSHLLQVLGFVVFVFHAVHIG